MMAWVRTAVALIGFGFTSCSSSSASAAWTALRPPRGAVMPRLIGLALIGTGVVVLTISAWQYHRMVRYMWTEFRTLAASGLKPVHTPTYAVMVIMTLIGVFAFVSVLTRAF